MIIIDRQYFENKTGIDLTQELRDGDITSDRLADTYLERWSRAIYQFCLRLGYPIPEETKLSALQKDTIEYSIAKYGLYVIKNGDPEAQGGIDEDGRALDLMPQFIIADLSACGLIRHNLSSRHFNRLRRC